METLEFKKLLVDFPNLSNRQKKSLKKAIIKFESIKFVSRDLESEVVTHTCPHCGSKNFIKYGLKSDMQRYMCKTCKKTFNSLTGSPLAHLHKKGLWLKYALCLVSAYSVRKSAKICGVSKTTAFRWRHRFLENAKNIIPDNLNGVVESINVIFAYSEKGNKEWEMERSKNVVNSPEELPANQQVPVMFATDRGSNAYDKMLFPFNEGDMEKEYNKIVSKDSFLFKYDKKDNKCYAYYNNRKVDTLHATSLQESVHVRNVVGYVERFMDWMERFDGVATKYLVNYLSWFRQLDEFQMDTPALTLLLRAKSINKNGYQQKKWTAEKIKQV